MAKKAVNKGASPRSSGSRVSGLAVRSARPKKAGASPATRLRKFKHPGKPPTHKNLAIQNVRRNAWFHGLTREQQAVAIAEDHIALIKAKRIMAANMSYLRTYSGGGIVGRNFLNDRGITDTRGLLQCSDVTCAVCERGGMLMARANIGNDATTLQDGETFVEDERKYMVPIFGVKPLRVMEAAYELWKPHTYRMNNQGSIYTPRERAASELTDGEILALGQFIDKHMAKRSPGARQTFIAKNIIRNKGVFTLYGQTFQDSVAQPIISSPPAANPQ